LYFSKSSDVNVLRCRNEPDIFKNIPFAAQAAFNASGKDDEPLCLPNTRVDLLQQIRTWADGDDGRHIFWLRGWAGTGKSTIARTIAREYYDKGCPGASFFFSRGGGDVSHTGKFAGSIAVQLAQRFPAYRDLIHTAISNNRGIVDKILEDQWKELILNPLSKLDFESIQVPLILVVDALDECDEEAGIQRVVQLLANARLLRKVWFRVLITSRPEVPIRYSFSQLPDGEHQDFVLHDIPQCIVDNDIYIFLEQNLKTVAQKRALGPDWPGEQAIRQLVRKAASLFIWATTVYRFIDEGKRLAARRLSLILQGNSPITKPEYELNKIYITVLKNSISHDFDEQEKEDSYRILREILGAIVVLFSPLSPVSLAELLHISKMEIEQTLEDLHSILDIPKDPSNPIRLHHPSFRDFLLDQQRCGDLHFWVDEKKAHRAIADCCVQLMSDQLRKDICGLHAPGFLIRDIQGDKIKNCLPAELQYACLYWVQHLQKSDIVLSDNGLAHIFLREHLLHWFEALSLIGKTSDGVRAIVSLESIVKVSIA
jgi:hypothetical protein